MDYMRKLNIIGDIDETSYKEFVEELDGLETILEGDEIHIELMSHGGDAMVALAFYDRIRSLRGKVTIYATGMVASAAVIILAAGDKRLMSKSAWVMVHDDTTLVTTDDRVSQAEVKLKTSRRLENQWCKILADRTKTSSVTWQYMHENETHLDATECLKLGLIDRII